LERLWAEEKARLARDEESLNPVDSQAKKHLSRAQVNAWREALEKGEPFGKPTFKFRALLDDGMLKLDGLSKRVAEMPTEDLIKVLVRLTDLADELGPVIKAKVESERQQPAEATEQRASPGLQRLKDLGLEKYAQALQQPLADATSGDGTLSVYAADADEDDGAVQDAGDEPAQNDDTAPTALEAEGAGVAVAGPPNVPEPELTKAARSVHPSATSD
jgi:hypothetical protein